MNFGQAAKDELEVNMSAGGLAAAPTGWLRRPLVLSTMAVITLLIVTASVFTVSLLARDLSRRAQQSHMLTESLRIASGVSAELAVMGGYVELGSEKINTASIVFSTEDAVVDGLSNLEEALGSNEFADDDRKELRSSGEAFVVAARDYANGLATRVSDGSAQVSDEQLEELRTVVDQTYQGNLNVLVAARDENLDELRAINAKMNRVGSAGGFVIAFLVPAAGLYLFEALRRNQGQLRLVERRAEQQRVAQRTAATEAVSRLRDLNAHTSALMHALATGAPDQAMGHARSVNALVGRATTTAMFNGAMQATAPATASLHQLIQQCSLEVGVERLDVLSDSQPLEEAMVEVDPAQLHSVLRELIQNAMAHGSGAVGLEYKRGANYDTLSIIDDGPGLPDNVEQAIFDADSPALRSSTRKGEHGAGLVVARATIEANGGSLDYSRSGGLTRFTLVLPRALSRPSLTA